MISNEAVEFKTLKNKNGRLCGRHTIEDIRLSETMYIGCFAILRVVNDIDRGDMSLSKNIDLENLSTFDNCR